MSPRTPHVGSKAEQVAAQLEVEILESRSEVGTHLGLRSDLIARFGVSPSVMNEALRLLRERGLVTVKPGVNGGIFVADLPPQVRLGALDLWFQGTAMNPLDLFEARVLLEDLFATVAMQRAVPEDIRAMEWALEEMRGAQDDARRFLEANMRFHLAIARAARVGVLVSFYEAVTAVLSGSLTRAIYVGDYTPLVEDNLRAHAALLTAIRDGDRQALEKALDWHRKDLVRATEPSRSPGVDGHFDRKAPERRSSRTAHSV